MKEIKAAGRPIQKPLQLSSQVMMLIGNGVMIGIGRNHVE